MNSIKLKAQHLNNIAEKVAVPKYDRSKVNAGIVHVGIGGFHRAHQAFYTDQLLHMPGNENWGICGIALLDNDEKIFNTLKDQDGLYTLVVKELDGSLSKRIIGSIVECLFAPENPKAVIDKMAHESIRIITLTITEVGYNYNEATKLFDFKNPLIQHDLENPSSPKTIFGYLTQALKLRKGRNLNGLSIQSCDNIQGNGHVLQKMLLSYVVKAAPELVDWVESNVSFPNSMVDRITPVTTQRDIEELKETSGIDDAWPVVCEPFKQWVIEDDFVASRPPLENVGVQFVQDVIPYEKMKIRLLNAGHSVLGIPGAIHGHPTIDVCMEDPVFAKFMRQFMDMEVTPILGKIESNDIEKYKDSLEKRFANPNIKDSVSRICAESAAKLPKFLIPTLQENLENDGSIKYCTFILAAWCYYSDKGIKENGEPLEIIDVQKEELHQAAKKTENDWTVFLNQPEIFEKNNKNGRFIKEYTSIVQAIYKENNIRKLMNELLKMEKFRGGIWINKKIENAPQQKLQRP